MKNISLFVIISTSLCLSGCITSQANRYPGFNFLPTDPKNIQVYYIPPTVPFELIGEVRGEGPPIASWDEVETAMKKAVAKIGGDAIVIVSRKEPYVGTYKTPSSGNFFIYGDYIYYTYKPGSYLEMRRKNLLGVVIKWQIYTPIYNLLGNEKQRLEEIINEVIENADMPTERICKEFWALLNKINLSKKDIELYKNLCLELLRCINYFWEDALCALSQENLVNNKQRKLCGSKLLDWGIISNWNIKKEEELLTMIRHQQPIRVKGEEIVLTKEFIELQLSDFEPSKKRIEKLFASKYIEQN